MADNRIEEREVREVRDDAAIESRSSIQSMGIINLILGAWLIVSAWFLNYNSGAIWNQEILGIIVVILSLVRLAAPSQQWASFLNGVAGIWLIIAPFIIGFQHSVSYWNSIIVGIIIAWIAFSNSAIRYGSHNRMHHGSV